MVRVSVQPLYVGGGSGSGGYYSTLLRLGKFSFLMNCGASDALRLEDLSLLLPYLNEIDAIFISHGTLRHAGGLPLLHRRNKQILSSSSHLLKRKKIGERKDGSSGGTQRERTCVSSGLPGDASSSQKARQSRGREEEAEEDGAKSFDGEDRDRLCCCFTKRCLDCSVPAYITQPAQRLGLVALDGAVRSRGGGVCTPLSQDGGWINSPDWTVDDGQTNADGAGEEREHKEDRNDLTESAGDDDALRGERIVVRKLEGCEATLGGFVTVSLADVHDVMQACRTLRYDERICLSPRKRKRGKRRGETRQRGRGVEGCEGERPRRVEEENGDGKARDRVEVTEEEHGAIERKRRRAQPVGDRFQGVSEGEGSESDDDEDDVEVYVHCVRAGHTIGGAVWLFDAGGRKIIFGVDHCLSPLWHVDGSSLLHLLPSLLPAPSNSSPSSAFSSPSRWSFSPPCLLISDVHHSPLGGSSWRVPALRSLFLQIAVVLHRGGDVIIPVDLGSPVLELLLHLEALWRLSPSLHSHHIFFACPVALEFLLAVKPLLPQSTERFRSLFANQRVNPLYCSKSLPVSAYAPPTLCSLPAAKNSVGQKTMGSLMAGGDKRQKGGGEERGRGDSAEGGGRSTPVPTTASADGAVVEAAGSGVGNAPPPPLLVHSPGGDASSGLGDVADSSSSSPAVVKMSAPPPSSSSAGAPVPVNNTPGALGGTGGGGGGGGGHKKSPGGGGGGGGASQPLLLNQGPQGGAGGGVVLLPGAGGAGRGGVLFGSLRFIRMLRNEIELDWVIRNGGGGHEEQQEDEGGGLTKNTGSNTGHVFVCTPASLDTGLSRELLLRFAEREDSVFFFLTEPWRGTTAHRLWELAQPKAESDVGTLDGGRAHLRSKAKEEGKFAPGPPRLVLSQARRVCLPVSELFRLFEKERDQRIRQKRHIQERRGEGKGILKGKKHNEEIEATKEELEKGEGGGGSRAKKANERRSAMKDQARSKLTGPGKVKQEEGRDSSHKEMDEEKRKETTDAEDADGGESGGEEEEENSGRLPSSSASPTDEGEAEKDRDGIGESSTGPRAGAGGGALQPGEGEAATMQGGEEEALTGTSVGQVGTGSTDRDEGDAATSPQTQKKKLRRKEMEGRRRGSSTSSPSSSEEEDDEEEEEEEEEVGGEDESDRGFSLHNGEGGGREGRRRGGQRQGMEGRRDDFSLPVFGGGADGLERFASLHGHRSSSRRGGQRQQSQGQRGLSAGEDKGGPDGLLLERRKEKKWVRGGGLDSNYLETLGGDPFGPQDEGECASDEEVDGVGDDDDGESDDERFLPSFRGDGDIGGCQFTENEDEEKKRQQKEEESHGDFGLALSAEQKALWATTTTSFSLNPSATAASGRNAGSTGLAALSSGHAGMGGVEGSSYHTALQKSKNQRGEVGVPVLSFSLLPCWPDSGAEASGEGKDVVVASYDALSGLPYGHLGGGDNHPHFIGGAPRKRQKTLNLLRGDPQATGGVGRAAPAGLPGPSLPHPPVVWGSLPAPSLPPQVPQQGPRQEGDVGEGGISFVNASRNGVQLHNQPHNSTSLFMSPHGSSPYGLDGGHANFVSSASSSAVPLWRKQLRQWHGGEDPTCLELRRLSLAVRCCVRCFTGGLEGVTGVQSLVQFISLLQPLNVFLLPSNPIACDLLLPSPVTPRVDARLLRKSPGDRRSIDEGKEGRREGSRAPGDSALSSDSVGGAQQEEKEEEMKMRAESEAETGKQEGMVGKGEECQQPKGQTNDASPDAKTEDLSNTTDSDGKNDEGEREEVRKASSSPCGSSAAGKESLQGGKRKEEREVSGGFSLSLGQKMRTLVDCPEKRQRQREAYEFIDCLVSSIGTALGPNCSVQVLLPPCACCSSSSSADSGVVTGDDGKELRGRSGKTPVVFSTLSLSSSFQNPSPLRQHRQGKSSSFPACFSCFCPCRDHGSIETSDSLHLPHSEERHSTMARRAEGGKKEVRKTKVDSSSSFVGPSSSSLDDGDEDVSLFPSPSSDSFVENQFAAFLLKRGKAAPPRHASLSFMYHAGFLVLPSEQVVLQLDRRLWVEFAQSACPALSESHNALKVSAQRRAMQVELEILKRAQTSGTAGGGGGGATVAGRLVEKLLEDDPAGTLWGASGGGGVRQCFVARIHATAVDTKVWAAAEEAGKLDDVLSEDQRMKRHQELRGEGDRSRGLKGAGGSGGDQGEGRGVAKQRKGGRDGSMTSSARNEATADPKGRRGRRRFDSCSDDKKDKPGSGDFWCLPLRPSLRLIARDDNEREGRPGCSASASLLASRSPHGHVASASSCLSKGGGGGAPPSPPPPLSGSPARLPQHPPAYTRDHSNSQAVKVPSPSLSDQDVDMTRGGSAPGTPHQVGSPRRHAAADSSGFSDACSTGGDSVQGGKTQLGRLEDEEDFEDEEENSSDENTAMYSQRKYLVSAGERKSTLLLGRMKLGDVASYLNCQLGFKGGRPRVDGGESGAGESQKSREIEERGKDGGSVFQEDGDFDFVRMSSDLGLTLTVGDCASLQILQEHNGGQAALWRLESFPHPWFFYLRRLFQSQPFALTGS